MLSTIKDMLDKTGKPLLQEYGFQTPLILYYHAVSDSKLPHISHLYKYKDSEFFIKDLNYLQRHYTLISPADLLQGKELPADACLLTFDDGFRECSEVIAPILLERGIEAAFFLNPAFLDNQDMYFRNKLSILINLMEENEYTQTQLECCNAIFPDKIVTGKSLKEAILTINHKEKEKADRALEILGFDLKEYLEKEKPYMTTEQVNELISQGFYIGSHSIDHAPLAKLEFTEQYDEMIGGMDMIQDKFKLPYRIASLPHNDRNLEGQFYNAMRNNLDLLFGGHGLAHLIKYKYYRRVNPEHSKNIRFFLEKQFGICLVKKYF
ncbi:MAG: polysaccharide deacetylase family protein [Candidatus Cloacimonetes bacterium]|nr:polysaccharide deacetylase family protein [Candidatus Cloacimonadota bacterium]